jgi:uncharacterized membrane protein YidH (DUF202 family)
MKKFLFLLILVLATCLSVMVTFQTLRSEKTMVRSTRAQGPVVWVYTGIKLIRPFVSHLL